MVSGEFSTSSVVPVASFDTHFGDVQRLREVRFDAEACGNLLTHPHIGISPQDLSRIHIYIRPDYKFYEPKERDFLRQANPDDYDDAASVEILDEDGPFGRRGNALITIVYGSGFNVNALLCHEAIHTRMLLEKRSIFTRLGHQAMMNLFPDRASRLDATEEAEADRAMKDPDLKALRKGVIEIIRDKK